jgi:hypothetical protein
MAFYVYTLFACIQPGNQVGAHMLYIIKTPRAILPTKQADEIIISL